LLLQYVNNISVEKIKFGKEAKERINNYSEEEKTRFVNLLDWDDAITKDFMAICRFHNKENFKQFIESIKIQPVSRRRSRSVSE
jgi:hypothetical protein